MEWWHARYSIGTFILYWFYREISPILPHNIFLCREAFKSVQYLGKNRSSGHKHVSARKYLTGTGRNNNVFITSKRRRGVVLT